MSEVGMAESVGHAIVSGTIKIPMGFANLAEIGRASCRERV